MTATTDDEIVHWISRWLEQRNPGLSVSDTATNIYDAGYVDSFGLIELIDDIERHFCIHLSQSEYGRRDFATIAGMASIIRQKRAT